MQSSESQANILIVDDTPKNLHLLLQILATKYKVRPCPSGELALKTIQVELPDLILLDIKMPNLDGYEFCKRLKSQSETANIPVIFISALDEAIDKVKAFQVGGIDYITKPFHIEEVLIRVQNQLAIREAQQQIQQLNNQLEIKIQLQKINQDLRGIFQSMQNATQDYTERLYLEGGGLELNLRDHLTQLFAEIIDRTLERDFPGFAQLKSQITPNLDDLELASFNLKQKRGLCLFLQEALCNIGKHAIGTTRIEISFCRVESEYCLRIVDNGMGLDSDHSLKENQGTKQSQKLAETLGGNFRRLRDHPQGTICELTYPI